MTFAHQFTKFTQASFFFSHSHEKMNWEKLTIANIRPFCEYKLRMDEIQNRVGERERDRQIERELKKKDEMRTNWMQANSINIALWIISSYSIFKRIARRWNVARSIGRFSSFFSIFFFVQFFLFTFFSFFSCFMNNSFTNKCCATITYTIHRRLPFILIPRYNNHFHVINWLTFFIEFAQ